MAWHGGRLLREPFFLLLARRVQEMRKTREQRFVRQAAPEIRGQISREMREAR